MTITDTSILTYSYVSAALFGLAFLFFVATSFHYAIKGRTRISSSARYASVLFALAHIACLFDMAPHLFYYIRPSDVVKIYWIRAALSVLIFPLALLSVFELLHCPKHDTDSKDRYAKKGVLLEVVYKLSKWIVFFLAILGELILLPGTISDSLAVRYTAYAIGTLVGILSLILFVYYYRVYGLRLWRKGETVVSYTFFHKKSNAVEAFVAWIILLVYFISKVVVFLCGHTLLAVCTYDVEVAVLMSLQILLIVGCLFACKAARNIHIVKAVGIIYVKQSKV